jgi:hypothetical protein
VADAESLDGVSVRTLNSLAASERTSAAKVSNIAARGAAAARVRAHVKEVEHLKNRVQATAYILYTYTGGWDTHCSGGGSRFTRLALGQ